MNTTNTTTHDVVVVGARAAGAATAMLLARAGLDVLVVDRSPAGADTLSTHALIRGGVVQLHRWGLLDDVIAAGTPAVRRTTFTYADEVVPITIKPSHGVDALYAPRRTVLDPILVEGARDGGADVRHGITVSEVSRDGSGRVTGVHGRDGDGRPVHHLARWVVGADGIRSVVAREVGAATQRQGTTATAVVYGYWRDVEMDGYHWIFRPGACAGAIPTNHDRTCVFAAASPARVGTGGRAAFHDVLRTASPALADRLTAAGPPEGLRGFGGLPGYVRRPWGPGWALVGDAGYWKDPIGAHGLTDALRDAELLAGAIIGAAGGGVTERDALDEYHRTRDRLSLPLFEIVERIAGLHWTDEEISALLLQLSSAMGDEVDAIAHLDAPAILSGGRR